MDISTYYQMFNTLVFRVPYFSINKLDSQDKPTVIDTKKSCEFIEALFLASPVLYEEYCKNSSRDNSAKVEYLRFFISIYKYFSRMCIRCTPFGLFAGCGIGHLGAKSEIILGSTDMYRSSTRLDMNYLCALIYDICSIKGIKKQIKYYPNTSLYSSGRNLRYTEFFFVKTLRKYRLSFVEQTDYLNMVLKGAEPGAKIDELASLLVDQDINIEEAQDYIDELIDNQLLISELEPSVTGDEMLQQLLAKLQKFKETKGIMAILENIDELLQNIDKLPIGRSILLYNEVKDRLNQIETKFDKKYLFQSDLSIYSSGAIISPKVIDLVEKGISILNRLTPKFENPLLNKFKEDFYKKYEEEEIPLVQALDVETGIGFGNFDGQKADCSPFLEGIRLPMKVNLIHEIKVSPVNSFLLERYDEFLRNSNSTEMEINETSLKNFPEVWDDLPDTISAMCEVLHNDDDPLGPLIHLNQAGGSSAANLLSRFCYLNEEIHEFVKEITQKELELNPNKILAEIVHLPEARVGNILMRPILREYEIPYLTNSSADPSKTITLNDLMISVPNGKYIKLRSKKLNKEVFPRLSSAHNFSNNSLPIYHFLCSLQTQNLRVGVGFNWGVLLENRPFLPRVRYENIILSPAIWNIIPADTLGIPPITDEHFFEKVAEFRNNRGLPERVLLIKGDNKLLIDFTNLLSVQMLFSEVKKNGFKLEEFLFDDKYPFIKRDNEIFTNQVILCFHKKKI